jgi:4-amino-4-deoxy-L-arabinose transferase-like glycosyltransferase
MGTRKRELKRQRKPSPENVSLIERYAAGILTAILLLALILRIAALKDFAASIYSYMPIMDEKFYHIWASKIADGTFSSEATYRSAPLPAYLMAVIYKIFSPDISYIRNFHMILGVLTCWLIYEIGRRLGDRITGLSACLIAAVYGPFIFYSVVPLSTMQSVCLFATTVLLFLITIEKTSGGQDTGAFAQSPPVAFYRVITPKMLIVAILLGLSAGLLIETRGNAIILVPVIPVALLFFAYKKKAPLKNISIVISLFVLGFCFAVAPFAVRNFIATGHFSLSSAQTGFALYAGNNLDNPDPYYRPSPFASSVPSEQMIHMTIEASRRTGKKLSNQDASSYWMKATIKTVGENPEAFLRKTGQKVLALLNRFEAGDHYDIDFMSRVIPLFKFPFIAFALVLPLGMAGMMISIDKSQKAPGVILLSLFYSATLVVFFTSDRLRLPLLVLLIPFAVLGVQRCGQLLKVKSYKKAVPFFAAVIVVAIVEFIPVRAAQDMTVYYNVHANALFQKGLKNEAIRYWKQSSEMNGSYSVFANLALAGLSYGQGDAKLGYYYLNLIPDKSFAAAWKYDLMGDVMARSGQTDKAIQAYERSLEINSGNRSILMKLRQLYGNSDPRKVQQIDATIKYIASFYNVL